MDRRKVLALVLVWFIIAGMLGGCAKNGKQDPQAQAPQPPTVSREGWQGYAVAGLTVYLPEMFEEGRIYGGYGEFISQDEDFEGDYIQLRIIADPEDEYGVRVTDADALVKAIQTQVEEDEGAVYAAGTYWDVPYLIYSEFGSKQDYIVVGAYAKDGRGWVVEITGMQPERALEMVPYACGGVTGSPAGWQAGQDRWMEYNVAGLSVRVPGELLEEADFYPDCAYFVDSQWETELEVMSGDVEEFDPQIDSAKALADWFARETEADGDTVIDRGEKNGVPYLVCGDGEDAVLVAFYVSGERYWMIAAECAGKEPEAKWVDLVTGGKIADGV